MTTTVRVEGLKEFQVALKELDTAVRAELRDELAAAAEPIARTAHNLALHNIRRINEPWSEFRVGVTNELVYIVPKQRGVKGGPKKRPQFGSLLMHNALEPAVPTGGILERRAEIALRHAVEKVGL